MKKLIEEHGKLINLGKTTFESAVMLILFGGMKKERDLDNSSFLQRVSFKNFLWPTIIIIIITIIILTI